MQRGEKDFMKGGLETEMKKTWRDEYPNWRTEMSMDEVIHKDNEFRFAEFGFDVPEFATISNLLQEYKHFYENATSPDVEFALSYDGIEIKFPKYWANELAVLDRIYDTIFEHYSNQNK